MSHPRIEEVSDSDPDIEDPADFLPANSLHALQPAEPAAAATTATTTKTEGPNPTLLRSPPAPASPATVQQTRASIKHYVSLYPIYFSAAHTRAQGRRVSTANAVANPLAYNLIAAVRHVLAPHQLAITLEPSKTHPRDWANPGCVRVQLFAAPTTTDDGGERGRSLHPTIRTKTALYNAIGRYLRAHPTQPRDPLQLKLQGLRVPDDYAADGRDPPAVPVPRGWRIAAILPLHSPAVSGGGVSDNFFKDAVEEMKQAQAQGMLPPGAGAGGAGGMPDMSQLQAMMQSMGGLGAAGGGGSAKRGKKR